MEGCDCDEDADDACVAAVLEDDTGPIAAAAAVA